MSDRRPENELWVRYSSWMGEKKYRSPSSEELLAAVRRGVESGEIEGEVVEVEERYNARGYYESIIDLDEPGVYILIGPVSDGGSET